MKYVVHYRNTGLGDCLISMLSAWRYACDTGRILVVDWRNSCYCESPQENAFTRFFMPPDELFGVSVEIAPTPLPEPCWPPRTAFAVPAADASEFAKREAMARIEALRQETVAMIKSGQDVHWPSLLFVGCLPVLPPSHICRAVLSELQPPPEIKDSVESFAQQHFKGRRVLGVHLRHGNGGNIMAHAKYWEPQHEPTQRCIRAVLNARAQLGSKAVTFVCSDSLEQQRAITHAVNHTVVREKYFLPKNSGELHLAARDTGHDALIEMLLLQHSSILVRHPPDSYFSWWPSLYADRVISPFSFSANGVCYTNHRPPNSEN